MTAPADDLRDSHRDDDRDLGAIDPDDRPLHDFDLDGEPGRGIEPWVREIVEEDHDLAYLTELSRLQLELLKLQNQLIADGRRLAVLFEGRDTAGKGGAILRFSQYLRPRHVRIVALPKPTRIEESQWYFERYVRALPEPGQIGLFDRSWYNRAVVEPVMGFCSDDQYERFMRQVVEVERMLLEDGLILVKLWFSIERDEQLQRLERRGRNPLTRWKLSTVDQQAQLHWERFTHFKNAMFERTSTSHSPWIVVNGNDKKRARLESIRHVLGRVDYAERGQPGLRLEPRPDVLAPYEPD